MAVQYDPWAQQTFDLSRAFILTHPTPPICIANELANSTTRSTFRLHWDTLTLWDNFGGLVTHYWTNLVPAADKQAMVFTRGEYSGLIQRVATFMSVGNEGDVKGRIQDFVVPVQASASNGRNGAPRPSDYHSILQRWEQGI
jgi:hypothetical protein